MDCCNIVVMDFVEVVAILDAPCFTLTGVDAQSITSAGMMALSHTRGIVPELSCPGRIPPMVRGVLRVSINPLTPGLPLFTQGPTETRASVLGTLSFTREQSVLFITTNILQQFSLL